MRRLALYLLRDMLTWQFWLFVVFLSFIGWIVENNEQVVENVTLIAFVPLLLGLLLLIRHAREQRQRALVERVRKRLVSSPPQVRYKTVVQQMNGSLVSFTSRTPIAVGTHVTGDINGELAPMGHGSLILGVVVSQEVEVL